MPYFNNSDVNILFIHIPKTGGSSIKEYLSQKYSIECCANSFCGWNLDKDIGGDTYLHFSLNTMLTFYKDNLILENLKVISVVRNPYSKIISNIFYRKKICEQNIWNDDIQKMIEIIITDNINSFLENQNWDDNHHVPQYKFLCDEDEKLYDNVNIFKFENLKNDIEKFGFTDFDININKTTKKHDYIYYLNANSINLINKIYKKDFELFGYEMIHI
jgi:hypothetical protein